jgi:CBS domain containing-hemolysin-like protein
MLDRGTPDPLDVAFIVVVVVSRTVVVPIFGLLVGLFGPGELPGLVMGVVIVVVVVTRTVVVPIFGEWLSSSWAMQRARFWRMSKALSLRKYMVSCVRDVRA